MAGGRRLPPSMERLWLGELRRAHAIINIISTGGAVPDWPAARSLGVGCRPQQRSPRESEPLARHFGGEAVAGTRADGADAPRARGCPSRRCGQSV
jgi:hypothetical protein